MKKFFNKVICKRSRFLVDEENVTKALSVLDKHVAFTKFTTVGNCGWADEPEKWFIFVTISNEEYTQAIRELKRDFSLEVTELKEDIYIH